MRGFTIIEILMTVAIAAILVAVGVPSFKDFILSARIKSAASDVYGALVFARSEAIKRGSDVTVDPVSGGWINGWQVKSGSTVLRTADAVPNLSIQCPSGTSCAQTVTYRRDGRLSSSTSQFVIDVASPPSPPRVPRRCVSVSVSGQINVLADNNLDGNCSNG
jgi:type IV fimbrial biogenesis protein FimT